MTAGAGERVALVTGASRGLGEVIATFLAREGYRLVLTARGESTLDALVERLRRSGAVVSAIAGDVANSEHRAALGSEVAARGRLDLLVNNASELGPSPLPELADHPLSNLERVLAVNLLAPLALVQTLRGPLEAARGLVVNISSDAAVAGYPRWGGYGASKAALDLLSLTLAHELASRGISVVSVDPGDMRTAMHQAAFPGEDISDRPLPSVTLPFWAWLVHQSPSAISGHRFRAQADRWEVPA
jgi:NAD(P)-dependent dehydrogenase (short-subunit alcohol dehydrogenase family)